MCIICDKKYDQSITHLNCNRCPELKNIPLLTNLIQLDCCNCPNLKEIPLLPNHVPTLTVIV